jgi:hypothetical protein
MKIVVARYKEDVSWLKHINNATPFIVNKFHTTDATVGVVLPNVGRESHSYLWYIINNYVCLDEHTCFLQGNPFPHCPDVVDIINNFDGKADFTQFGKVYDTVKDACPHHSDLIISAFDDMVNIPDAWSFNAGAQFIVSKQRIQRHSKEFYQQLFERHSTNEHTPWCLERLWKFIFGDAE